MQTKQNADLLVSFGIVLGSLPLLLYPIPLMGSFVIFVSLVLLQGWLFCTLLFARFYNMHLVLQVILIYVLGSIFLAIELWLLISVNAPVTHKNLGYSGYFISVIMVSAIAIKRAFFQQKVKAAPVLKSIKPFLVSAGYAIIFAFFVWLSEPIKREPFTEFFIQATQVSSASYQGQLVIANHEGSLFEYTIRCEDGSNVVDLLRVPVPENTRAILAFNVNVPDSITSKLQISLYLQNHVMAYRTVETYGQTCADIQFISYSTE